MSVVCDRRIVVFFVIIEQFPRFLSRNVIDSNILVAVESLIIIVNHFRHLLLVFRYFSRLVPFSVHSLTLTIRFLP